MAAPDVAQYDAEGIDVRIVGGVAVLTMTTDRGRVIVSTRPEVLERLSLAIQMELAQAPQGTRSSGSYSGIIA